jgi:hypothetical protein
MQGRLHFLLIAHVTLTCLDSIAERRLAARRSSRLSSDGDRFLFPPMSC